MQDQSCFSEHGHAREEVCVPVTAEAARGWFQIMQERRCLWVQQVLGEVGSREGSCGAQYIIKGWPWG